MAKNYREGYDLFACNGILFNHESPRRGETFVTRKITRAVASILAKKQDTLYLGNLNAKRDWGFSPEYVELMWRILNHDKPDDYVSGTGETHTVQEFVDEVFNYVDLKPENYVHIDPAYYRPTEVEVLAADPKKSQRVLNWSPKVKFKELARIMVDADMRAQGLDPIGEGDDIIKHHFPNKWWIGD
jgi:GDPmannose 4,6-dehydratase